jgi:hypothetical protein
MHLLVDCDLRGPGRMIFFESCMASLREQAIIEVILLSKGGDFDGISLIIVLESPMTIKFLIPKSIAKRRPCRSV